MCVDGIELDEARSLRNQEAGGLQSERGKKTGLREREVALPLRQEGKRAGLVRPRRRKELWKDRILREVPSE